MESNYGLLMKGAGKAIVTLLLVLVADAIAVGFAFMFLMGDHTPTVPPYTYWRETGIAAGILLAYSVWMLGVGFSWQFFPKLTPRIIGFALGITPVFCLSLAMISRLIINHL